MIKYKCYILLNWGVICIKVLELFAGTRSIGKAFKARGHEVFSVEWNRNFDNIDLYKDINELTSEEVIYKLKITDIIR